MIAFIGKALLVSISAVIATMFVYASWKIEQWRSGKNK